MTGGDWQPSINKQYSRHAVSNQRLVEVLIQTRSSASNERINEGSTQEKTATNDTNLPQRKTFQSNEKHEDHTEVGIVHETKMVSMPGVEFILIQFELVDDAGCEYFLLVTLSFFSHGFPWKNQTAGFEYEQEKAEHHDIEGDKAAVNVVIHSCLAERKHSAYHCDHSYQAVEIHQTACSALGVMYHLLTPLELVIFRNMIGL